MEHVIANAHDPVLGQDYQDTITLLQEEIARLEEEIGLRDEALAEQAARPAQLEPAPDLALASQVSSLTALVAERDETIAVLLDEIRLVEEAEAASRAEWEHLSQWVTQVEERVALRNQNDSDLAGLLAEERQKHEAARLATDAERRVLESQRQTAEEEAKCLHVRLASVAKNPSDDVNEAIAVLEHENERLREACGKLRVIAAEAGEVEALRAELTTLRGCAKEAQAKSTLLEDGAERERKEYEAELASLRTKIAQLSVQAAPRPDSAPADKRTEPNVNTAIDERIRAYRMHLKEVHQEEQEERARRRFTARLSRLWHHTGPNT
ncbi:MAG TPA: hypothetical protein VGY53_11365 [Isosphaeraceae bacterium]|nr:hypothetical protein [Isosphaeraceae bacterium]